MLFSDVFGLTGSTDCVIRYRQREMIEYYLLSFVGLLHASFSSAFIEQNSLNWDYFCD